MRKVKTIPSVFFLVIMSQLKSLSSLNYKGGLSDFYHNNYKAVDLTQNKNQKSNILSDSNHICADSNLVK